MRTHSLLLAFLVGAAGCPSAPAESTIRFPARTTGTPSSPRCQGERCQCRSLESNEGQSEENLAPGAKRFELRLPRTTSALWISVAGKGVFYKAPESMEASCFYVDLPAGEHALLLHSESKDPEIGLQTGLDIFEYGPRGPYWYRSLQFTCGGTGRCTRPVMESWVSEQRKLPRGVLDPCGSTMIRGVTFRGSRTERQLPEYLDLDLGLTLKIYAFETEHGPGSPECRAPVKNQ